MPDHAGSTPPKDAAPHLGLRMLDGAPEQDDIADRRTTLRWVPAWAVGQGPIEGHRFAYGDLFEGTVAVVALLAMVLIGVPPWLAILLSVVTYVAAALLRPAIEHAETMIDDTVTKHALVEVVSETGGHQQLAEGTLTAVDAVAAHFGLTRREQEVLPLLAQRLTDREIAQQLSISHRTAMNHTANILGKLGLASRRDVAACVAQHAQPPSHESE